jgi:decaprenylphospho-beta-D-ribofuranose 2-oxidase
VVALGGWGRTATSTSRLARPSSTDAVGRAVRAAPSGGLIPRGMGRSYGDAALCTGGEVLDLTTRDAIPEFDHVSGTVVAQAGATLAQVMAVTLPQGWLPPVLPGTAQVTIGGAVAADVHGKNHVGSGSFARHVQWIVVVRGDGETCLLSPRRRPEEYWATVGGMGLTGVVVLAGIRLRRVGSASMLRHQRRAGDLAETLAMLDEAAAPPSGDPDVHAMAWVDGRVTGAALGRGIVESARFLPGDDPRVVAGLDTEVTATPRSRPPSLPGPGVVGRGSVRLGNLARWVSARGARWRVTDLASALHPLDRADAWPAAFGRDGLVQYQFAVPLGSEPVLRRVLSTTRARGVPPALAVLKRFGEADGAPLSFPTPGWTLAMDFPARWAGLAETLGQLDDMVADAGGRVYLAKDSRLSPAAVAAMYPRLDEWRAVREAMDPRGVFASDLGRRLHLVPGQERG